IIERSRSAQRVRALTLTHARRLRRRVGPRLGTRPAEQAASPQAKPLLCPEAGQRAAARRRGETEAAMKHPSTRELFEYWNKQRGRRPAPERNDIEPGAIRRVLADTFVLAFDTAKGHPFRIAGTRVCAAFGRELKGEQFVGLWDEPSRTLVRDLVHIVAHEAVGVVASAACANAEGARLDLE